jgi:putative transposase
MPHGDPIRKTQRRTAPHGLCLPRGTMATQQSDQDPLEYRFFYRRNLPHYQPGGATFFLTYSLAGSLPTRVVQALLDEATQTWQRVEQMADTPELQAHIDREQRRLFGLWDRALHHDSPGPFWLRDPRVAALVVDSLHYIDGRMADVAAFCVMPNHVHLLYTPLPKGDGVYYALTRIQHSIKLYTARRGNELLQRNGAFWRHENYDHMVRNAGEFERIRAYILNNPVKAGLVKDWKDWPWSEAKGLDGKTSYLGPLS